MGHSDAVRCIIHVPEKQQYITASWDRTIRVWKAYQNDSRSSVMMEGEGVAAVEAIDEGDGAAEEKTPTYAELHPLIEPKCLSDRAGRGSDYFSKKV